MGDDARRQDAGGGAQGRAAATDERAFPADAEATIRLFGTVNDAMLRSYFAQLDAAQGVEGPVLVELTTEGGDADIGRRLALEMKLLRRARGGRRTAFHGKTVVYSAGVTLMSGFSVAERWLSSDAVLLIHERKLEKTVHLSGALRGVIAVARDLVAEIENGQRLEREGFADLVEGSGVPLDELMRQVGTANWYLTADEALERGLVAGVV